MSMSEPTVTAIMLVNGRPEMVDRSLKAFRAQTYRNKQLLIYDTSKNPLRPRLNPPWPIEQEHYAVDRGSNKTIGELRNQAIECCSSDIIVHWDSDDWSSPERISEQVALLEFSKKECVGYREMLFWEWVMRCCECDEYFGSQHKPSCMRQGVVTQASMRSDRAGSWVYTSLILDYCLGTSLCYWRGVWQDHRFPAMPRRSPEGVVYQEGEDMIWQRGVTRLAHSAVPLEYSHCPGPRMVATIHGGNTLAKVVPGVAEWRRTVEWDPFCRRTMAL